MRISIVLYEIEDKEYVYTIDPPSAMTVSFVGNSIVPLWVARDENLGIDVHAHRLERLLEVVNANLLSAWQDIVEADDAKLTKDAQELKRRMTRTPKTR